MPVDMTIYNISSGLSRFLLMGPEKNKLNMEKMTASLL